MAVASGPAGPVLAGPLFIRRIRCLVMVANKTGNGRRRFVHIHTCTIEIDSSMATIYRTCRLLSPSLSMYTYMIH